MAPLEFRACVYVGALDRITIERIDLAAMTCTRILLQQPAGDCSLGLVSGSWCLARAIAMANTDCQGTESVAATGMSGTFAVTSDAGLLVDLDIILEFPDQAPVPEELRVEVASCDADCSGNECRP